MMKRMLSFLTGMLCLFLHQTVSAQPATEISGFIKDTDANPVSGATVLLKKLPDSALVRSLFTDEKGQYSFLSIKPGTYVLRISAVGYDDFTSPSIVINEASRLYDQKPIQLKRKETSLNAVMVKTTKPFLERQVDRTVMNVDAFLSAPASTALEMLEKAPGVNVDEGAGISLRGKPGVVVFIDDKPTYLSGTELLNYLRSLPASTLDKIEVITNPPARYDAAGNAGIINIKTKKAKTAGFNGGLNIALGQGIYFRTNNSLNFNCRHPKFNLFGTAAYAVNNNMNDLAINRYYFFPDGLPRFTFFQHSFIRRTSWASNLRIGMDYYLTNKTTIGFLANGNQRPSEERTGNTSTVRNRLSHIDSVITANNFQDGDWRNGSLNLNLLHKYNVKGKELAIDLDVVNYKAQQEQQFYNQAFGNNGSLKWQDVLTGNLPSDISIYSAKTDYSLPVSGGGKIAAGAKLSYVTTDNAANYYWTTNGRTEMDVDKTNRFLYKEGINAVYVNGNKDWKSFSLQLGLRLENTTSNGHQLGNMAKPDSSFRRSYTNLFPTAFFLYKLDTFSKHQISFSYGRRIDRPVYQDLNPFVSPLDKFSIYVGNPYLQPTFTNSFSLAHTFLNKITTTLSYSTTKNIIQETIDLSNNIYVSRPANIGKSSVLGLGVDVSLKPAKWWSLLGYAEVQNRKYQDFIYGYALDTSALYSGMNLTNQLTLGKGWSAELSGFYRTGILVGQITSSATGQVNLGIGKKVLKDKGSLRLMVRDIFYTRLNHGIIGSIKDAYGTYRNWGDSRNATLSFSYNFGSSSSGQRNRQSATEAEQNRVRN
jgi:hypothetical protein